MIVASLIALLAVGAGSTHAAPIVVDQQYDPLLRDSATVINQNGVAQTFTVGIDGILDSVEVLIARNVPPGNSIALSIVDAPGGTPDLSVVLASAFISPAEIGRAHAWVPVDLSAAMLQVVAGQQLGIHMTTSLINNLNTYSWLSDTVGLYGGGSSFWFGPTRATTRDYGFRTFVDTQQTQSAPEPTSLALFGVGLGWMASRAAKRRRTNG